MTTASQYNVASSGDINQDITNAAERIINWIAWNYEKNRNNLKYTVGTPEENMRQIGPNNKGGTLKYTPKYNGTDCSGFTSWILMEAGVLHCGDYTPNTDVLSNTSQLKNYLNSGYRFEKYSINEVQIKSGDLLVITRYRKKY